MPEYYFDIETYSPKEKPDIDNDKIISIQFQRIDLRTGKPREELIILKEWESNEEKIIRDFYNRFFSEERNVWDFVAVGFNLNFEWEFLIAKFEKYLGKKYTSREMHYKRPHLDIRHIIILANDGNFVGAKLDRFTKKPQDGKVIKDYYENKQFDKIESYIKEESSAFLELLQKIRENIHKLEIKPK